MKNKILVCSWGATMILKTFARVTNETDKTLKVVLLRSKVSEREADNYGTNYVEATGELDTDYNDNPKTVTLYKRDETYFTRKGGFYQSFKVWDGTPQFEDHND